MDFTLISQATSSLNAAVTLVKGFVSLRDETQRLTAVNEMLAKLFEANSKLNDLVIADAERAAEYQTLLREKRELEDELGRVKAEKADFDRYELAEVAPGVLAYALRDAHRGLEPMHYICPACRNNSKKSILKRTENATQIALVCQNSDCKVHLQISTKTPRPIAYSSTGWPG
ncbi:hypothetical protein NX774_12095 [Massilia agilis]|uniref:Phage protein n=1 Tax=Massilia agilis TaxID=1811226 RepID=A0ABT2DBL6_9BURK|nr:hypothetical protein [Massilia agilis]MCS0808661.1 hypothetical protein [Massilia agilis]